MPPYPKQPVADSLNPCYCPSVSARAYIHNLHQDLISSKASALSRKSANNPFARLLAQCLSTPSAGQHDKGALDSDSDTSSTSTSSSTNTTVSSNSSSLSSSFASGPRSREEQFHPVSNNPRASNTGTRKTGSLWSDAATLGPSAVASNTTIETTVTFDSSHVDNLLLGRFNGLRDSCLLARSPRKRKKLHNNTAANDDDSDPDSDLQGPPKQMKSVQGSPQRSFEVLLKRETLNFDKFPSSRDESRISFGPAHDQNLTKRETVAHSSDSFPWFLSPRPHTTVFPTAGASAENSGHMPQIVPRTKEQFMESIKQVAPMIRIPDSINDPQAIARYLGRNGLLTTALMCVLAVSNVQELLLGPSLQDYNGLNIGPPDLFRELHRHGAFKNLVRLSCDNVLLKDDSMVYLHCLPLQDLSLSSTNLTNAAIFLLIPLKRTLVHFSIGKNPAINDDAIPALIMLKNLKLLILEGTHVDMGGIRRFACSIHSENRKLRIDIPLHCQHYLDHMHHHYLLHPVPPLLDRYDREDIWSLQLVELRKNLAAHSAVNRAILTTGNKTEMRLRLSDVLMKRERDLMVKRMYEDGLSMIVRGHVIDGRLSFGVVEDEIEEESDVNNG